MKNTTVLIIRHGGKTGLVTDLKLDSQGISRSYALIGYFDTLKIDGKAIKLDYIFAAKDNSESIRPRQTVTLLAKHLNKTLHQQTSDQSIEDFANELLKRNKYNDKTLLICWRHEHIFALVIALGLSQLPQTANWPKTWPDNAYGWLIQIKFDQQGYVDYQQTKRILQHLMYTDYGVED